MTTKSIVRRGADAQASDGRSECCVHPVVRRVYAARHVDPASEQERGLGCLEAIDSLKGIEQAAGALAEAVTAGQRILVVGDFDADGATSSALAVRAFGNMGAAWAHYLVPNRFEYGYGLTPEIVAVAEQFAPDVLVTVDNGISSIAGVKAAKEAGFRVVVTDHHLAGAELPAADAIVNPNQPGDAFPSKHLAGVGVVFYVMLALRARLRDQGWFERQGIAEPNMAQYLDLVALGTVADVVPLDRNNRILVHQGILRIRAGRCRPGISALLEVGGRDPKRLAASDLGFAVGPRLNAAGRLEDMAVGIECLLAQDETQARQLAQTLDRLNQERREIETEMREQAMADIERLHLHENGEQLPPGLCLFDESWHQGVIGILASRVKERLHRPVIAFAPGSNGELKGSARSIAGLHIRDALDAVAARHPGLIDKFGGHAMAAGLSLERDHFDAFRAAFEEEVARQLSEDDLKGVIYSDGELQASELSLEVAQALRDAGPWGQGFPEPVFDGEFNVVSQRIVGEKHLKLTVRSLSGGAAVDAIAFNALEQPWPRQSSRVRLAYRLDVNEFRGVRSAQLIVEHMEEAD